MSRILFVVGGVRSGKSLYAERIACKSSHSKIYIATAEALDMEMKERIENHKVRRGDGWQTIEEPIEIVKVVNKITASHQRSAIILIDCLTLWLSNLLHKEMDVMEYIDALVVALKAMPSEVILVSSEVGMGIISENILARKFCDYAGILHQRVAEVADEVVLMVAGIPLIVKGD